MECRQGRTLTNPAERRITVAVVDYGMGNLFSVARALEAVGHTPMITSSPRELMTADAAVVPGVGAFGAAITALMTRDLVPALRDFRGTGRPLLGICLGLQLFMSESDEFGSHKGLGFIEGRVVRLPQSDGQQRPKVPHIGWNAVDPASGPWSRTPLRDCPAGARMYFVHSYHVQPMQRAHVVAETRYAASSIVAAVKDRNVFGVQFHPEKSGPVGLTVYRNLMLAAAEIEVTS